MNQQIEIFEAVAAIGKFYNTVRLSGQELKQAKRKAGGQNEIILKVFQDHPQTSFTPWSMHLHLGQQFLIGSVRRAMTTLTAMGYLEKSEKKVPEKAGAENFTWRLKTI